MAQGGTHAAQAFGGPAGVPSDLRAKALRGVVHHVEPPLEEPPLDGPLHLIEAVPTVASPDLQGYRQRAHPFRQRGQQVGARAHLADHEDHADARPVHQLGDAVGDGTYVLAGRLVGAQLGVAIARGLGARCLVHGVAAAVDRLRTQAAIGMHGDIGSGVVDHHKHVLRRVEAVLEDGDDVGQLGDADHRLGGRP
ncbi:Uncharacterised protein [Mycobacterium tuberculosis]|nr:Uncharacterised protein [Mycobacterium tuberculosis]